MGQALTFLSKGLIKGNKDQFDGTLSNEASFESSLWVDDCRAYQIAQSSMILSKRLITIDKNQYENTALIGTSFDVSQGADNS